MKKILDRPLRRITNSGISSPDYANAYAPHGQADGAIPLCEQVITLSSLLAPENFTLACPDEADWLRRARLAHANGRTLEQMSGAALSLLPKSKRKAVSIAAGTTTRSGRSRHKSPPPPSTADPAAAAMSSLASSLKATIASNAAASKSFLAETRALLVTPAAGRRRSRSRSPTRSRRRRSRSPRRRRSSSPATRSRTKRSRSPLPRRARSTSPMATSTVPMRVFKPAWTKMVQRECPTVTTKDRTICPYTDLCSDCNDMTNCEFCHDPGLGERPPAAAVVTFLQTITKAEGKLPGSFCNNLKPEYASALDPRAIAHPARSYTRRRTAGTDDTRRRR
jgi:hypothetical protein